MKIVIAVLALTPTFAHAVTYDNAYYPLPNPPCVVDGCIPENPQPRPLPWPKPCRPWDDCGRKSYEISPLGELRTKTSGLSAAIADGKMDKAEASLNGLFAGAGNKAGGWPSGSSDGAVSAGAWKASPRLIIGVRAGSGSFARKSGVPAPTLQKINCGDKNGCKGEIGKNVEDVIDAITKPIEKWVDRDRTQDSRDTYGGCRMKGTCPK